MKASVNESINWCMPNQSLVRSDLTLLMNNLKAYHYGQCKHNSYFNLLASFEFDLRVYALFGFGSMQLVAAVSAV